MPTTIKDAVEQARARIARYQVPVGEQNTKAALIEPVLRVLGWDVEDVDEVHREYRQRSMDAPVDYALVLEQKPVLFVEAKGLRENLDDRRWAGQIVGYAAVAGVEWVVLTNGDEYRIYNAHAPVPVHDKLFRVARISDPATHPEAVLELFTRVRMMQGHLTTLFKAHFVDHQVREALAALLATGHPDPALVRLIGKYAKSLTAGEIKAGLDRLHVTWDAPSRTGLPAAPPAAPTRPRPTPPTRPVPAVKGVATPTPNGTAPRDDSILRRVMAARPSKAPLELEKVYNGRHLTARVELDGRVTCLGQTYNSLSTAAGGARATIIGAPSGRKYPQTNGWSFWRYRDEDGQLQPVDNMRQALRLGDVTM
jgi:hypothetical protein